MGLCIWKFCCYQPDHITGLKCGHVLNKQRQTQNAENAFQGGSGFSWESWLATRWATGWFSTHSAPQGVVQYLPSITPVCHRNTVRTTLKTTPDTVHFEEGKSHLEFSWNLLWKHRSNDYLKSTFGSTAISFDICNTVFHVSVYMPTSF